MAIDVKTHDGNENCAKTIQLIGKALRPMPPTWGDSEVGVHKIEGRQKKVRRERGTQRHRESGTGGQSGGNRAGRQTCVDKGG